MAKKKEIKEINNDVDLDEIKNELTEYIDQKLNKMVNDKVKKDVFSEIDKSNRRLLREKNRKIFTKNIIIILLLVAIGYLLYLLYDSNYFDKYFNKSSNNNQIVKTNKNVKKNNKVKEITLDDLKIKYGYMINDYYINENSDYINDYYDGNLTSELKNYLVLNLIDSSKLNEEDDYNVIDTDDIKSKYEKLFDTKYESKTFKYNGNTIRYISKIDSYISDSKIERIDTNIKREIIDINDDNGEIKITTVEGKVNDNKVYNILSNEELGDYNDDLLNYKDSLNKITYTFKNSKLVSINN